MKGEGWKKSYVFTELSKINWLVYVVTVILVIVGISFRKLLLPRVRPFYVNDATLWNTFFEDTIPEFMLLVYGILIMAVILLVEYFFSKGYRNERYWVMLRLFLSFAVCIAISFFFTECMKLLTGELRPDFGDRCLGSSSIPPGSYASTVIADNNGCSDTGLNVNQGRKSFVSGHASIGFAVCIFSLLYFLDRSQVAARRNLLLLQQILFLILFIPIALSIYICITRVTDNKHATTDVVGGAALGALITFVIYSFDFPRTYQQYYPTDYPWLSSQYQTL